MCTLWDSEICSRYVQLECSLGGTITAFIHTYARPSPDRELASQDCIAHIRSRDAVLLNVWQAYNRISEAAVIVGFKSSILDMAELKEAQAAQLLMMRDALTESQGDTANLQKTLAVITGAIRAAC